MATLNKPSVIGIDYTPAYEQGGGIGRYVRDLVSELAAENTPYEYRLFVAGATYPDLPATPAKNFAWCPTYINTRWLARIWQRAHLPLPIELIMGRLALYHATDFVLPPTLPQTRTLLTVHDLSFVRSPETATPSLRDYLNKVVPLSVARATHILADSNATKADLIALYNTPAEKISVLLSGVNSHFAPVEDAHQRTQVRSRYNIPVGKPYIFAVGTVQPRKNYARLVEALAILRSRGIDAYLVIAGGKGWLEDGIYSAIEDCQMQPYVNLIGFARDEDLPVLYSDATCSAFISLYEGFGLPILESMACATPVVTSNTSSLPEVAGDAAILVNPTDVNQIADALQRFFLGEDYAQLLRTRGLARVKQFSWRRSAQQLVDIYQHLLRE